MNRSVVGVSVLWLLGMFAGMHALPAIATAAAGDPARGEVVYQRCLACHALAYNRTGPRHCGVVGRRAGDVAGFDYSTAMRNAQITWTVATLDRFLAAPTRYIPGTTMGYAGIKKTDERRDLIAFLTAVANDPAICAPSTKEGVE